jgi:HK97 family phage prohead protease
MKKPDFSGWVTKNDIRCADGVVIRRNAFSGNDGASVPLVWNHNHDEPSNVLGNIKLENRSNGVYGYGYFNDNPAAKAAKELIRHGDIASLSIAANKIKRTNSNDVIHGNIYEVSLVLAGANPGACISDSYITHSANYASEDEHIELYTGLDFYDDQIMHADDTDDSYGSDDEDEDVPSPDEMLQAIISSLTKEELSKVLQFAASKVKGDTSGMSAEEIIDNLSDDDLQQVIDMITSFFNDASGSSDDEVEHSGIYDGYSSDVDAVLSALTPEEINDVSKYARSIVDEDLTDDEIMQSLSDDQVDDVMDYVVDILSQDNGEIEHLEEDNVRRNVFDNVQAKKRNDEELDEIKHTMLQEITSGSDTLQGVYKEHKDELLEHGIEKIDDLFTVEQDTGAPEFLRPEEPSIVDSIIGGVTARRARSVHGRWADIREDEARARGYVKGKKKFDEVFKLLNRRTFVQTIYKKQSFDRDDYIDIEDFDLLDWVKPEMKEMLSYEIARAIVIGDGRDETNPDKIKEEYIRPIALDDDLFNTKVFGVKPDTIVETIKKHRRDYRGLGRPIALADLQLVTDAELIKDGNGAYLYGSGHAPATDEDMAKLFGVKQLVMPEFMDGTGLVIIVNLKDYEIATPAKGVTNMFDDFDIDYNKMKTLIETRCGGALNRPYSAVTYSTAKDLDTLKNQLHGMTAVVYPNANAETAPTSGSSTEANG